MGIPSGPLGPWRAGINYFKNYQEVMREGYEKVRGPRTLSIDIPSLQVLSTIV